MRVHVFPTAAHEASLWARGVPSCVCGARPAMLDLYLPQVGVEFRCPNGCRSARGSTPDKALQAWVEAVSPHQMD